MPSTTSAINSRLKGTIMGKLLDNRPCFQAHEDYYTLLEQFPLKPIRDDKTHASAVAVVTMLAQAGQMNQDQSDYFDVLSDLISAYENRNWPIDTSDSTVPQIIESFMEDHGMSQSDLGRLLGERTMGHKILSGKRQLTVSQVKKLAETFKVSPKLFM